MNKYQNIYLFKFSQCHRMLNECRIALALHCDRRFDLAKLIGTGSVIWAHYILDIAHLLIEFTEGEGEHV